jgi:phosphohistidine phosphatase
MNLYLIQHAEAKREDEDPERHLSEKGLNDIKKVASFVSKQMNIQMKNIMHSGKTRAKETAQVLCDYLKPPEGIKEIDGLEPMADPSIWMNRLTETKEDIIIVGHLPHLSKLSAGLLCQDENKKIIDFRMAGIVCLKKDETEIWSVQWMVIPHMVGN